MESIENSIAESDTEETVVEEEDRPAESRRSDSPTADSQQ
jgi:hypothetical protein